MNRKAVIGLALGTLGVVTGLLIYNRYFKTPKKNLTDKKCAKGEPCDDKKPMKRKINFKLPDLENKMVSLEDYKGKYVLFDVWQTTCPHCRHKNKELAEKKSKIKAEIVGICLDTDKNVVEKALKEDGVTWKTLIDTDGKLADNLKVDFVPYMFLVNPEGYIIAEKFQIDDVNNHIK